MRKTNMLIHIATLADQRFRADMPYPRTQGMQGLGGKNARTVVFAPNKLPHMVGLNARRIFATVLKDIAIENILVHLAVSHLPAALYPPVSDFIIIIRSLGHQLKASPPFG